MKMRVTARGGTGWGTVVDKGVDVVVASVTAHFGNDTYSSQAMPRLDAGPCDDCPLLLRRQRRCWGKSAPKKTSIGRPVEVLTVC